MSSPFSRHLGPALDECNSSAVLVVSPNPELRHDVTSRLQSGRWTFAEAGSGAEALQKLEQSPASLILLDPGLPDLRVEEFRNVLQSEYPDIEIVTINPYSGQPVVTAHSPESLCFEIIRHLKTANSSDERSLPVSHISEGTHRTVLPGMVGTSAAMQRVYDSVRDLTRVPNMPEFVDGVINLRGQVIPVIGLRRRFGMEVADIDKRTRIVVAEINGAVLGFVVDEVSEVLRISSDTVEPPPRLGHVEREYVQGIGKLEGRLLILIDLSLLITTSEHTQILSAEPDASVPAKVARA